MRVHHAVASRVAVIAAALAISCGGSVSSRGSGVITASGQVGGKSLPTADAIGVVQSQGSGATMITGAGVVIRNVEGTCGLFQSANAPVPGNMTTLALSVNVPGDAVPAGSYAIRDTCAPNCPPSVTGFAIATYAATDAHCNTVEEAGAVSGTVILTSVTATAIDGSFDLLMQTGDHVTGQFIAPLCDIGNTLGGTRACR